jgi:hypothetical protein
MSFIDELRQQCHDRYEEYDNARTEWLEAEANLVLALQDEEKIANNDQRARKIVFFACFGMTIVTMAAKWWS